jgi:hypothetical protein
MTFRRGTTRASADCIHPLAGSKNLRHCLDRLRDHVESRSGDAALTECFRKRRLVDHGNDGAIDSIPLKRA